MHHPSLRSSLSISLALLAALSLIQPSAAAGCRSGAVLAKNLLAGGADSGDLAIEGLYGLDEEALLDDGRLEATVAIRLTDAALRSLQGVGAGALCISLVLDVEGELRLAHHRRLEPAEASGASPSHATAWAYGLRTELPELTEQLLVLIEEPRSGLWGVAVADEADSALTPGPAARRLAGHGDAWLEVTGGPGPDPPGVGAAAKVAPTVVRLVPPRQQPATGPTRFDALVSTTAVARIVFELDGEEVASRKRSGLLERPFAARIELADPPRVQTLVAIAFDSRGREVGRDTLAVNQIDAPLRVRIRELTGDPASGSVEIAADVTTPAGTELDRIEVYRNQTLVTRLDAGPVRTRVPTPAPTPEDYIRVAAFLSDGTSIDDVVLLAAPGEIEQVEVNLVGLHVVATDDQGRVVDDLQPEDFEIIHRREVQPTQSFAYADDVTLLLGLVIDTSGSMRLVMHDTRRAAAKFLGSTVLPQDRAFLVDFDRQPRLLHPTSADLPRLLRDLAKLEAEGETAMYDAIVFSMLQFQRQGGRKALVVLTDGDDLDSRFGPKYCAELARDLGVPIYIIGLGNLDVYRRTYSKKELRRVTEDTGGRLYFVDSLAELDDAYAQINAELRSQYSLSFYVDSDLDASQRRDVEVRIRRSGVSARTVVGSGPASP
ncbi:MAG: VWA domain-containing protein [Acidobacteriota bacterium]